MHFRTFSKLSRYFWMTLKYFSWFQNCLDISKLFQIFRTDTKLSEYFQMTKKSFRQFQNCLKTYRWPQTSSGKFPDNFKLFFTVSGMSRYLVFIWLCILRLCHEGQLRVFFSLLWETLTQASSGKLLHVESCYPESFVFFASGLNIREYNLTRGTGMEYLSYW